LSAAPIDAQAVNLSSIATVKGDVNYRFVIDRLCGEAFEDEEAAAACRLRAGFPDLPPIPRPARLTRTAFRADPNQYTLPKPPR